MFLRASRNSYIVYRLSSRRYRRSAQRCLPDQIPATRLAIILTVRMLSLPKWQCPTGRRRHGLRAII